MNTNELREAYLSFFESKDCVRRPSDVLVPKDDPTVLFTPAGMNQFKNQFLGIGPLEFTRATTSQKCLRTGDISNVGVTAYHHTFFEMLGNFSFGDYFKREAIHWAWEFLTDSNWLALDPTRLSVTVYLDDDEAFNIWEKEIGLPKDRIQRLGEDENFWPAEAPSKGPDGVCGPCSEIYYHPPSGGKEVEIWNLVFTQFNRVGDPPDNLRPLPKQNIDTGMGLERTAAVLQGVESNYEIDILKPLCLAAGEVVGTKYDFTAKEGRAIRRISDHVRACTFAIHEGATPGSKADAYIIRLLLRRAFLEGYLLGHKEPFLHEIVPTVVDLMSVPYPELKQTVENVQDTIREEEEHFLGTIDRGLHKYDKLVKKANNSGTKELPGKEVFDLHQTDGFILDLTSALAADQGLTIDMAGFKIAEENHRRRSGGDVSWGVMAAGPLDGIQQEHGETKFLAYEGISSDAIVVGMIVDGKPAESVSQPGTLVDVLLNQTPFYGESGGQVGDQGVLKSSKGEIEILDTQKHAGLIVHRGRLSSGEVHLNSSVHAEVESHRRHGIQRAHSATHLLHHALHIVLGEHAMQRGSKVENDHLRFDFSHGGAVTSDELRKVEDIVNSRISEGASVSTTFMDIKEARAQGAMALFGEKYPDRVRMVSIGEYSKELCGGTHLTNTGQVGVFRIESEENVAAGVRRIVASTGKKALERIRDQEELLKEVAQQLKAPQFEDLPRKVSLLQDELKTLKQQLTQFTKASVKDAVSHLLENAEQVGDAKVVCHHLKDVDRETLREYADQLRQKGKSIAVLLGAEIDGKVALLAAVSKDLVKQGVKAGDCVREAAKIVGGGGGGRPDLAEAGGKDASKIDSALVKGAEIYKNLLAK
ncbi:alanine--tRNA ligase [Thalassoglobus polymorphus]|uniref:Alanine--tRNA ligase n=1 Tax=Thalassoglobus polymorphus TaxID=2527994 RepID=A0A517QV22_9PLAN|nr:alanine--tRNA ligase [Thalassoglobus polymorphus]QDT35460.1 Alanine--tRNA ligase [Thalassoglobus polymorphus]